VEPHILLLLLLLLLLPSLLLLLLQDVDVVRQLEAGHIEVDLKPSTNFNNGEPGHHGVKLSTIFQNGEQQGSPQ
jgi:hypothetical protein